MLDRKLMQTTLEEINMIRRDIYVVSKEVDVNHLHYKSLLNLKHYLQLRSKDRTKLQEKLFLLSLSSLGRSYAHVGGSLKTLFEQINSSLHCNNLKSEEFDAYPYLEIQEAIALASQNAVFLFGGKVSTKLSKQTTAIMITLPSNAAEDKGKLIVSLANAGVNAFRINTAHDDASKWQAMANIIENINSSRDENQKIKIFVDLAGPKIRTGEIRKLDIPIVIGSNKSKKEVLVFHNQKMRTTPEKFDEITQKKEPAHMIVNEKFFRKLKKNAAFKIIGINEKKTSLCVLEINDTFAKVEIEKKVHIDSSSKVCKKAYKSPILNIEKQTEPIRLFKDDLLEISKENLLGRAAIYDEDKNIMKPALISCSFAEILEHVNIGEKVFIDDGKIGLEIIKKEKKSIICKVVLAKANGTLLKEEKGINFPDTHIKTAAMTVEDRKNALLVLDFVDHFSLSFCQTAEDVCDLKNLLTENKRNDIGIVAKIETRKGVVNMPEILEELLAWDKSAVMIARGDLAIEVGFQNLAYTQEMLLDICDAAHIPVIWATQVLENQMKTNLPSRAEITDAAMAGRAECVMLNKGAFAEDTVGVLTHILDDMHSIFKKNRQLLTKQMLW